MTSLGPGPAIVAVDVGGTDTKCAVVDAQGEVIDVWRTPTPRSAEDPAGATARAVADLLAQARQRHPDLSLAALGVAVPGQVDEARGLGLFSSNLGWRNAALRDLIAARVDVPVAFAHDVRSAGRAERELGAARGAADAVVIVIGTGIAAAVITGGVLQVAGGGAGEIGHSLSTSAGEVCSCGAVGCLETVASAGAIERRYRARTGLAVDGARGVLRAAEDGDAVAQAIWDDALTALAEAIARLAAVLSPEVVVIGGGLAQAGEALLNPVAERVDALLSFHRRPKLVPALLGEDAGVWGVALAAREVAGA